MAWLFQGKKIEDVIVQGRKFEQGPLLAEGGFAYVYKGIESSSGQTVAIRRVLRQEESTVKQAREEHELLASIGPRHQHIVLCIAADIVAREAISVFEYCPHGTVLSKMEGLPHVRDAGPLGECPIPCFPEAEVIQVLYSTALALAHLHGLGIVHYDVKSENLLLGADLLWKLGDFGSASRRTFNLEGASVKQLREAEEFIHGRCTPICRAPEAADVHLRWSIGPKMDLFALGCVLFATLSYQHPFPMDSVLANIQAKYSVPKKVEEVYSPQIVVFLHRLLAREPGHRLTAQELCTHIEAFKRGEPLPLREDQQQQQQQHLPSEAPTWEANFDAFAPPMPKATPVLVQTSNHTTNQAVATALGVTPAISASADPVLVTAIPPPTAASIPLQPLAATGAAATTTVIATCPQTPVSPRVATAATQVRSVASQHRKLSGDGKVVSEEHRQAPTYLPSPTMVSASPSNLSGLAAANTTITNNNNNNNNNNSTKNIAPGTALLPQSGGATTAVKVVAVSSGAGGPKSAMPTTPQTLVASAALPTTAAARAGATSALTSSTPVSSHSAHIRGVAPPPGTLVSQSHAHVQVPPKTDMAAVPGGGGGGGGGGGAAAAAAAAEQPSRGGDSPEESVQKQGQGRRQQKIQKPRTRRRRLAFCFCGGTSAVD